MLNSSFKQFLIYNSTKVQVEDGAIKIQNSMIYRIEIGAFLTFKNYSGRNPFQKNLVYLCDPEGVDLEKKSTSNFDKIRVGG